MVLHFQLFCSDLPHLNVDLQQADALQISNTNDTETTSSTLFSFLPYFVDPKDHGIFQVKRQLLGGTEVGETLDAGHHLFYADHLHYVGHHQGIDEVDVGALQGRFCVGKNVKMTSQASKGMSSFSSTDKSQTARQKH